MARASLRAAVAELATRDPVMMALIDGAGPPPLRRDPGGRDHYFAALCRSILFQQLAGKAAEAIHGRFVALLPDGVTPEGVLAVAEADLRGAGLSGSKAASIHDLAAKVVDGT